MNRLKQYDEAETAYQAAILIDPGFIQSYIGLGDIAVNRNDSRQALEYYRKALDIEPSHSSTRRKVEQLEAAL